MSFNIRNSFFCGLIFVLFFLLFGPYTYKIYNSTAIIYLFFCFILFFVGMSCVKNKNNRKKIMYKYNISKVGIIILLTIQVLAIVCAIYFIYFVFSSTGSLSFAGGDFRNVLTENRTMLQRFTEAFMHFSAPIYLLIHYSVNKLKGIQNLILLIGYWLTPLSYLSIGARWSFFFYLILFLYVHIIEKHKLSIKKLFHLMQVKKVKIRKLLLITLFLVFLIIALNIVFTLFSIRGLYSANEIFMFERGDITLKNWAKTLYELSMSFFDPLYKISNYFSHSIPAFTYFFDNFDTSTPMLFGLYSLSVLQYLFIPFGFSTSYMKNILFSLEGSGLYMTFLHGYIVDFGIFFAPIVIFLTGYLYRYIELRINKNILCRWFYPYIIVMCFIAPIYNMWTVAMVNIDLFFIILLYFSFKKLSWNNKKIINIIHD